MKRLYIGLRLAAITLLACHLFSCGLDLEPDREGGESLAVRVDSVGFFPSGRRYLVLPSADSQAVAPVEISFASGYSCSRVDSAAVTRSGPGSDSIYTAQVSLRLPGLPDCPVETRRDTLLYSVFHPASRILLRGQGAAGTDTLRVLHGEERIDSVSFRLDSASNGARIPMAGRWYGSSNDTLGWLIFRRTVAGASELKDSLDGCHILDWAVYRSLGRDSLFVIAGVVALEGCSTGVDPLQREGYLGIVSMAPDRRPPGFRGFAPAASK